MMITYFDLVKTGIFIVALMEKSKLLDFPTNLNLYKIQTFLSENALNKGFTEESLDL